MAIKKIKRKDLIKKINKLFGRKLALARVEAGFSQEDFAERLGVSKQCISYTENGVNYPRESIIKKMEKILGCVISDISSADIELIFDKK